MAGRPVVRIDVTATEKRRARGGLTREDFVVLEDGKPQPIVQFQAFSRPVPSAPAPAENEAAEGKEDLLPARYVVLAIDDVHMSFESLARARKALDRFIAQDLSAEDQGIIAATQRPAAFASVAEPSGAPAWKDIASYALIGTNDRIIPPSAQRAMAAHAGAEVTEIAASHVAMLSQPDAVADLIRTVAAGQPVA